MTVFRLVPLLLLLAPATGGCTESSAISQKPAMGAALRPAVPSAEVERRSGALVLSPCRDVRGQICFVDSEGRTRFWVEDGRMHSAEVRERQQRYNVWARSRAKVLYWISTVEPPQAYEYYRPPERRLTGRGVTMPTSVRETGRLDQDTIAIPLYRSVHRLLVADQDFVKDCQSELGYSVCGGADPRLWALGRNSLAPPGLSPALRRRFLGLVEAFAKSDALANALEVVLKSSNKHWQELVVDGADPDALSPEALRAMERADLELGAALAEVEWARDAYRAERQGGRVDEK